MFVQQYNFSILRELTCSVLLILVFSAEKVTFLNQFLIKQYNGLTCNQLTHFGYHVLVLKTVYTCFHRIFCNTKFILKSITLLFNVILLKVNCFCLYLKINVTKNNFLNSLELLQIFSNWICN
jgi:hypothetical protein